MATCAKSVQSVPVLSLSPSTRSSKFPFQPPSAVFFRRTATPTSSCSSTGLGLSVGRSHLVSAASASNFAPNSGDLLGDVRIFTASGEPVRFKDLWDQSEGIAVVALLRHFGCICCWELAAVLKESKVKFDSAGVKLIAVGVGTPDKARILAERALEIALLQHTSSCIGKQFLLKFEVYPFQWNAFMLILTERLMTSWVYIMGLDEHSLIQPVPKCSPELIP